MMAPPLLEVSSLAVQVAHALGTEGFVVLLVGSGGVGAIAIALINKHKPKVTRQAEKIAAENSEHERASDMSLELADRLDRELKRQGQEIVSLRQDLKQETTERVKLAEKVERQNRTIFSLKIYIARVLDWWDHITRNWDTVRMQAEPPMMPEYIEEN